MSRLALRCGLLTELRISNFALIERLSLSFSTGFHVFTGETGAGKSIIVDAISLLVGGRATVDQIRADAEEAVLEGAFTLPPGGMVSQRFRDLGLLDSTHAEVIIRRILSRAGRHRIYVNGNLTPLHVIQELAGTLIDIHGQHEQQSLLSSQLQLEALDAFGHLKYLRGEYAEHYRQWQVRCQELAAVERIAAERCARQDLLHFQHDELMAAELREGEDEELAAERHRLTHARRLSELAHDAYDTLYGGDRAVLASLGTVARQLAELADIDPTAQEWTALCEAGGVQLRELAAGLRAYHEILHQDPDRLLQVEERLDRLQRLQKKYGGNTETLLARAQSLKLDLDELAAVETRSSSLRLLVAEEMKYVHDIGARLSDKRRQAAGKMETRVKAELNSLRMGETRFGIVVRPQADATPGLTGFDDVEYVLSANPGEPLQALARVASGGELSRVMLALKSVMAEMDHVPIVIFDEVDAGIGGAVASVMGRRLRALSRYHQVFCITHLPQIASQAATHFLVQKQVIKKRTVTRALALDQTGRRDEIARMLGGLAITKAVRETAAEMIGDTDAT